MVLMRCWLVWVNCKCGCSVGAGVGVGVVGVGVGVGVVWVWVWCGWCGVGTRECGCAYKVRQPNLRRSEFFEFHSPRMAQEKCNKRRRNVATGTRCFQE